MKFETILYEKEGPLAWITLNRPDKLNAINRIMVGELNQALDEALADETVRVILVKGEGRAFSAGFDLEPQHAAGATREEEVANLKQELRDDFDLIMRFWDSPKPAIAAIHGYCLGGALELALACDITIATHDCRFGSPELLYGSGAIALLLPWLCGPKRAKEILLTATDRVTTVQAAEWGLVNRVVVNEGNLVRRARECALEIARNDKLAVQITKQAINTSMEIGHMREAMKHALELELAIETTETPASITFDEILRTKGVRAALEWREEQLGHHGRVMRHEIA